MSEDMVSYAYLHCRPDGTPFYVGKGQLKRVHLLRERNKHHTAIVSKYGETNILIGKFVCSSEQVAYDLETGIIKRLRAMGARLCNYTAGGDGGREPCEETRKRLAERPQNKRMHPNTLAAIVRSRKGVPCTAEHRERVGLALRGKKKSLEAIENNRLAHVGLQHSEETRQKMRESQRLRRLRELES